MAVIIIRNLPTSVHEALRQIAVERRTSVAALAREALSELALQATPGGIDFGKLAHDRAALRMVEDGPDWNAALDDPALSHRVLGLDQA
jgi:plasmid stability protein